MRSWVAKKSFGLSLVEIVVAVALILSIAVIAVLSIMQAVRRYRLRSAAYELAGLIQDARSTAENSDNYIAIQFNATGTTAFTDPGGGATPVQVTLSNGVIVSPPPDGSNGSPTALYKISSDTGSTTTAMVPGTRTMAFSKRGLPCDFSDGVTCVTPAASSFVYYLNSPDGWAALVVARSGQTGISIWKGASWSRWSALH